MKQLESLKSHCPHPDLVLAAREGVLPEGTGAGILAHLAECPLCQALARDLADPELSAPTIKEEKRILRRVRRGTGERPKWPWLWFAAPAAAVAALGLVFLLPREPRAATPAPLTKAALEKPPVNLPLASALVWRGAGDEPQRLLQELGEALEPYRAGQYEESVQRLAAFTARYPKSPEAYFYLGVSLLFLDRKAEAAVALARAQELATGPLAAQTAKYLDLARR
jgi:TolA-binding protein